MDKDRLTQVGRAPRQLQIEHIPSSAAQGRGRIERLWGTLRSRLPPLLRQAGVGSSIEAANRWLTDVYMAQHNARFGGAAAAEGSAFIPFAGALDDIPCIEEERVVGHDNTVRYEGHVRQILEARHRRHFVKARVRVHEYWDGSLALFHGPRRIASYTAEGSLADDDAKTRGRSRKSAA